MTNFSTATRQLILFLIFLSQAVVISVAQQDTQQAAPHCSNSSLNGGYGFSVNGITAGGLQYSLVGRFVADGKGGVTGTSTQSVAGAISRPTFTAKYTVNADCTGTTDITFDFGLTTPLDFIITDDGKSVYIISAGATGSQGDNETGTATRQFNKLQLH
ncbi:MAG: hypothetical protein BGO25_03540 [Acidobacteriales bacterium 59-55]|nr:hypothetical protein [Terriglobales bacterium]OJV40233.1 MAG: hypothetical protein BGO25_03540 [Acidobacteriales bacterium 59-55]